LESRIDLGLALNILRINKGTINRIKTIRSVILQTTFWSIQFGTGGSGFEAICAWVEYMTTFIILQLIFRPLKAISYILICLKWGDWKNWRKYYPTILYVIIWDLIFALATSNYPLWTFSHPILKNTFSDLLIALVSFPCAILLYLPYIPKKSIVKQIFQIAFWAGLFSLFEAISLSLHTIDYYNGWNYWWSVAADIAIFCTIRLHYEKPLLAWPLSVLLFIVTMIIFKFPLGSLL